MTTTGIQDQIKPDTLVKVGYDKEGKEVPRFVILVIRGLGSPLRAMLSAAASRQRVPHWVALYDVKEETSNEDQNGHDWWKQSYITDKAILKQHNPLMNAPFLIDVENQAVIAQSNAIFTYLGRALGMMGSNPMEESTCEQLLCEIMDLRDVVVKYAYNGGKDSKTALEAAQKTLKGVKRYLYKLELHMEKVATSSSHLVGTKVSAPDFHLWEMLYQLNGVEQHFFLPKDGADSTTSKLWEGVPRLQQYFKEFENLPDNKHFFSTSFCHKHLPCNNPYALFGSCPTKQTYERGQDAPWRGHGVKVETIELLPTETNNKRKASDDAA
eukprot:CAMPEP_0116578748 /NCGR_PEP_ID=MMETSP0397-20121206/21879_1 /TAXON_ID=216820 /ORGANISM="Cyclophora tenuis, Strain ECT3854" /LENGTH=325 /DNA_ID=CAMNT_0004108173 /DNA_START=2776 /DNA_END=3754 /DNA_ORIENTATION=+